MVQFKLETHCELRSAALASDGVADEGVVVDRGHRLRRLGHRRGTRSKHRRLAAVGDGDMHFAGAGGTALGYPCTLASEVRSPFVGGP